MNTTFGYEMFTTIGTILLFTWAFVRLTHPFRCSCGYWTWFARSFKRHLLQGHKWDSH